MSAKPIRVLVVDDSALMRKVIPQILESDNSIQVVGTAIDGNFGLKKLDELRPQVVTLDLEMPGMGGLEMLKEIMRRQKVPVIVVSSHSTQGASVTLKALSLGAFDFVAKPFMTDHLIARVIAGSGCLPATSKAPAARALSFAASRHFCQGRSRRHTVTLTSPMQLLLQ